jgi:hypothetical protein
VDVPARTLGEPTADQFGLVARRVAHDDVHVEISGHVALDFVEELAELLGAVARHAFADDRSRFHIERGEQRRRAVAFVVVGAPLDLTRPQWPQRLGAVQRLDLALFIDTEHQSPLRRVEAEADNVTHFLNELRIGRKLESLAAMRGQRESIPDAMHCRDGTPDVLAIERVLQCVASAGIVSSVLVTTSVIFSSSILRGAPQRGSSSRPSKRFLANRFRHSPTVSRETPSVAAIAQLFMPSAANRTISARIASTRAIFRRRARISNSLRSLSARMIFTAGPRAISTSESRRQGEGITPQWLCQGISETGH